MTNNDRIQLVDKNLHRDLKVDNTAYRNATFATNNAMIIPSEMNQLVLEYPLFITKANQHENKQFTALFGIEAGQNLYIENNTWQSKFIPLDILRRPFCLVAKSNSAHNSAHNSADGYAHKSAQHETIIAIDTSSSLLSTSKGQALFAENGEASQYLERIKHTFAHMISGQQEATTILDLAEKLGLIDELVIDYQLHGQTHVLQGFYSISIEKLSKLSAQDTKACVDCGLLRAAYLLEVSKQNLNALLQKHETRNPNFNMQ